MRTDCVVAVSNVSCSHTVVMAYRAYNIVLVPLHSSDKSDIALIDSCLLRPFNSENIIFFPHSCRKESPIIKQVMVLVVQL